MGAPTWFTFYLGYQFGLMITVMRYNNGLNISIHLPIISIQFNNYIIEGCKKELFSFVNNLVN